jgi:hypothetical protein
MAKKAREPQDTKATPESDDDVEGHQFLPNDALARSAASSREREIQSNLQKQELKGASRRPFFRKKS